MSEPDPRFASIRRLYGQSSTEVLANTHLCVVGLGGVGSWAVEAAARSGVGKLTLIEFDVVQLSNMNRQLHTLTSTLERKKAEVLAERAKEINPAIEIYIIDDFITLKNYQEYLNPSHNYDYVIDAIDSIKCKAIMIYYCRRNKIPIITTGGAGGLDDPTKIEITDLSKTYNDALAAKVRSQLRKDYHFPTNPKRSFRVECVFSSQQPVYPTPEGEVSHQKPGIHGISLDCRYGYGSATFVTASFGFACVARLIKKILAKQAKIDRALPQ